MSSPELAAVRVRHYSACRTPTRVQLGNASTCTFTLYGSGEYMYGGYAEKKRMTKSLEISATKTARKQKIPKRNQTQHMRGHRCPVGAARATPTSTPPAPALTHRSTMQFGRLTLAEWHAQLATPPSTPSITPPPTPSLTPPPTPPPPLTWAARVATGKAGISPTVLLPSPRKPPQHPPASPPRRQRPLSIRRLRGLLNAGNSCFINVVLQALLACEPFRRLLLDVHPTPASLLSKFVRLAKEMSEPPAAKAPPVVPPKHDPLLPDWFNDVFPSSMPTGTGMSGGSQEDAEEFLTYVLNELHEEMVSACANGKMNGHAESSSSDGWDDIVENGRRHEDGEWSEMTRKGKSVEIRGGEFAQSGITEIFGGALRSEVKRGRGKPSVTREPFFSLSLDIESGMIRDLDHALAGYFEAEFLEGYETEKGETEMRARKQVRLEQMPQVLILHLKRFSHNSVTGALNKVSRMLMFPEVLRIPGRLMHSAASRWGMDMGKTYELTAVVTHVGKELAGGHYTCDVRWAMDEGEATWMSCDDSKVFRTSAQKVCHKQAYLLFYSMVQHEQ